MKLTVKKWNGNTPFTGQPPEIADTCRNTGRAGVDIIYFMNTINFFTVTILMAGMAALTVSCDTASDDEPFTGAANEIRLMTLNPGHFHAALVQKNMLEVVHPTVYIYAPGGADLDLHMERIKAFNSRSENPTSWESEIYTGPDYLDRMLEEQPGNVMVTAGNNRLKTEYIKQAVDNGIHVLSDKPMAVDSEGWNLLTEAFDIAEERDVLLYDIMTERYEITSMLQRELAKRENLFGRLSTGSPDEPAIVKESVHHLFKTVSGQTLRRPPWYFDVDQQGEGIVDVTTHLVDLSMWAAFPDEIIDHREDVRMLEADRWPTVLTKEQFSRITGMDSFPDYLQDRLVDGELHYYSNGEMTYTLKGHHARVSVQWNYEAPPGSGDTHFSVLKGSRVDLVIRQGPEQDFRSTLYVEPKENSDMSEIETAVITVVRDLQDRFPGLDHEATENGWKLLIPGEFYRGHEAHFGKVAETYFSYLAGGSLPEWEVPNMITKYYITTRARELAL
ncbi:MAG: putative oxidoreductase C-terminal domain-containing protein [Balneolaceae bacterium]